MQRGDRPYRHLFAWPFEHVHLPGLADAVEYAQFLHDASEVQLLRLPVDDEPMGVFQGGQSAVTFTLQVPVRRPDVAVPFVELFLGHAT